MLTYTHIIHIHIYILIHMYIYTLHVVVVRLSLSKILCFILDGRLIGLVGTYGVHEVNSSKESASSSWKKKLVWGVLETGLSTSHFLSS